MMRIRYSSHASERLNQRHISKDEVMLAIRDGIKDDTDIGSRKSRHRNEKGMLVVIYNVYGPNEVEIITAYWE